MTIKAVARFTQVGTDFSLGNYNISLDIGATNGTSDTEIGGLAQVPFMLNQKKADKYLRERAAAMILSQTGWVIDADDIYFPAP
jgi:hypothetical protein